VTAARASWDQVWLDVADAVAQRSLCERDRVGAVLVDAVNRIVDSGVNNPPRGFLHNDLSCSRWCIRAKPRVTWDPPPGVDPEDQADISITGDVVVEYLNGAARAVDDPYTFLVSRGYTPREELSTCYEDCPSLHAEANALMFSDRRLREGGTLYVTSHVCSGCAKLVANSGVRRVVVRPGRYRDPALTTHRNSEKWYDFMRACGLEVDVVATS